MDGILFGALGLDEQATVLIESVRVDGGGGGAGGAGGAGGGVTPLPGGENPPGETPPGETPPHVWGAHAPADDDLHVSVRLWMPKYALHIETHNAETLTLTPTHVVAIHFWRMPEPLFAPPTDLPHLALSLALEMTARIVSEAHFCLFLFVLAGLRRRCATSSRTKRSALRRRLMRRILRLMRLIMGLIRLMRLIMGFAFTRI